MPSVTLHAADNRITAQHAGKNLSLSFQRTTDGAIQPGTYTLSAPVRDIAYGTFAVLIPRQKSAGSEGSTHKDRIEVTGEQNARPCRVFGGAAAVRKNLEARGAWTKPEVSEHDHSSVMLVSTRKVPGRDVLVIRQGFFDLMSALSAAGGAEVQVV
jgi:hypothetical protein